MGNGLRDDWFTEHTGESLILDQDKIAAEIARLRAALDAIGAMFFVGVGGAVLLKPDYGNYDVLDAANAALADR